jgi:hypothetical protein
MDYSWIIMDIPFIIHYDWLKIWVEPCRIPEPWRFPSKNGNKNIMMWGKLLANEGRST